MMNKPLGLYIHIPFCKSICPYCDFNKMVASKSLQKDYMEALLEEAKLKNLNNYSFETLYIGGGTPSIIDPTILDTFLSGLSKLINFTNLKEFNFEANPDSLNDELLEVLVRHHINRLSIGIQSLNKRDQELLKRSCLIIELTQKIEKCRNFGLINYNFDLIYALPNQTIDEIKHSIDELDKLKPNHFSIYALQIEPHTIFYKWYEEKKLIPVSDEIQEQEYFEIVSHLNKLGYHQYEISNFAKEGFESKHNLLYWNSDDYLTLGTGATSKFQGVRTHTLNNIHEYLNDIKLHKLPKAEIEILSQEELIEEFIIMNLRKKKGFTKEAFYEATNYQIDDLYSLDSLYQANYLINDHNSLRINKKYFFVSNFILTKLLSLRKDVKIC